MQQEQQEQQEQAVLLETPADDTQNPQRVEAPSEEEHQPSAPSSCPPAPPASKAATPCVENHPPDEPKPPVAKPDNLVTPSNGTSNSRQHDPSNPFRALDTSDRLQHLFRKYPNLPEQLMEIYSATQPPDEVSDKRLPASLMQGVHKKDNWNHDIGIRKGKEALRKARKAEGETGDAIREYSELVLHLMNTQDEKGEAATVLQQQMAQEDSKLIERLMAQERG
ncbi:hypothetical protein E4U42_001137 [Claviceps africana]|uniref:Uncharacterized protein n=1 Tax=Claviceps africana TaxID=83212 RepID=A0A8K0J9Q2_9HYPO|nr:hypothetical protein E4U42_001137 [Claviceps africana]